MEVHNLIKLLGRFKRDDHKFLFDNWPPLRDTGLSLQQTKTLNKKALSEAVARKYMKKKPDPAALADLDLLYVQRYSSTKQWKVFKFTKCKGRPERQTRDAQTLEDAIAQQMGLYFDGEVHVSLVSEAFWVRLSLRVASRRGSAPKSVVTYVVHPRDTEYLVVSGLRAAHTKAVSQVFLMVLSGQKMESTSLSGKHIASLLQLVVNKHQGKQPPTKAVRKPDNFPATIRSENRAQKRKREDYVDLTFGSNKLPRLEHVDYKLETCFRGAGSFPGLGGVFQCRVRFQGPSVLEGLRGLASAGLADLPMKGHLANVHRRAQNSYVLRTANSTDTNNTA